MGAVNLGLALCSRGTLGKGTLRTYPSWRVPTLQDSLMAGNIFGSRKISRRCALGGGDYAIRVKSYNPLLWMVARMFYLINLKRTLLHLAGTKNSSWTDRICFWQDMKIFAEIEFRQKRIIPFSCSSYFVLESYLTHNTYIFF